MCVHISVTIVERPFAPTDEAEIIIIVYGRFQIRCYKINQYITRHPRQAGMAT
jgi:hypothetical protein